MFQCPLCILFLPILIFARLLLDFYCIFYDVPCTLLLRVAVDHDDDDMLKCRLVWIPQTLSFRLHSASMAAIGRGAGARFAASSLIVGYLLMMTRVLPSSPSLC